jgi:tetratricopeptide (TPR) repeat protein
MHYAHGTLVPRLSTLALLLGLTVPGCGSQPAPEPAAPQPAAEAPAQPAADADPAELERIWTSGGDGKWEAWDKLRPIYGDRNEMDKLFAGTRRAVEEGSPYWADYVNYGGMLVLEGKVGDAIAVYDAGLALAPDVYLLLTAKGTALWMLDRRAPAIAMFQRALAVATQERNQQEMHSSLAVLLHHEQGLDHARPHYQALTADTIAHLTEGACEVVAAGAGSTEMVPPMMMFLRDAFVHRSAGVAAYKLQSGDVDGARQVLSKLIGCGVSRQELDGLFGLAELINKSNMKL